MSSVKLLRRGVFGYFYSLKLKKLRDKHVMFIAVGQSCINYCYTHNLQRIPNTVVCLVFSTSSVCREFERPNLYNLYHVTA